MRDGSENAVKQHVWGLTYIDELIEVNNARGTKLTTTLTSGDRYFVMQDVHFNVMGLVTLSGHLIERYEYTPYGERQVFSHGGYFLYGDTNGDGVVNANDLITYQQNFGNVDTTLGDANGDGVVNASDQIAYQQAFGDAMPIHHNDPLVTHAKLNTVRNHHGVPLCDIGHQGLMHDEETGLVYNYARMLSPQLGQFMQREPAFDMALTGQETEVESGIAATLSTSFETGVRLSIQPVEQPIPQWRMFARDIDPSTYFQDGMSVYGYVRSSPVTRRDPSGLQSYGAPPGVILPDPWTRKKFKEEEERFRENGGDSCYCRCMKQNAGYPLGLAGLSGAGMGAQAFGLMTQPKGPQTAGAGIGTSLRSKLSKVRESIIKGLRKTSVPKIIYDPVLRTARLTSRPSPRSIGATAGIPVAGALGIHFGCMAQCMSDPNSY